jgi:hypothetical protein
MMRRFPTIRRERKNCSFLGDVAKLGQNLKSPVSRQVPPVWPGDSIEQLAPKLLPSGDAFQCDAGVAGPDRLTVIPHVHPRRP